MKKIEWSIIMICIFALVGCYSVGISDDSETDNNEDDKPATPIDLNITTYPPRWTVYTFKLQVFYNIIYDNGDIELKSTFFENTGVYGDEETLTVSEFGLTDSINVTFENYRMVSYWERELVSGETDLVILRSNGTGSTSIGGITSNGTWTSNYYTDNDPSDGDQSVSLSYISMRGTLYVGGAEFRRP